MDTQTLCPTCGKPKGHAIHNLTAPEFIPLMKGAHSFVYALTLSDGLTVPLTGVDASVRSRQEIEVRIASALIDSALRAGYHISVDNGEDKTAYFTDKKTILSAMFLTDEDTLLMSKTKTGLRDWVYFIYGNDGWDVISDYTVDLEPLMKGEVERLQDYYGG